MMAKTASAVTSLFRVSSGLDGGERPISPSEQLAGRVCPNLAQEGGSAAQFKGPATPRWLPDGRNLIISVRLRQPELAIVPKEGTRIPAG